MSLIRKAVMVGLGVGSQSLDKIDELAKAGEKSQTEYAKSVRTLFDEVEKNSKKLEEKGCRLAERFMERMPIPTRSDIQRLEKKIQELSTQVERKGKG